MNTHTDKEQPLISFVMPVYNDGDSVEKAIDSIFDSNWPNIEVVAVNDGSTDDSLKVLNKLKKKHKRLTVLTQENKGACVARNEGAKVAKGQYLAWLPADAKIYPHTIRAWMETFQRHDVDFVYGGYRFVDAEGNTMINYMGDALDPYQLEVSNYIDGSFPIKTETFWRIAKEMGQDGLWDPNVKSLQDWDFWLSVVRHGGKGFYFRDLFFETTIPHPGGLSYDSHNNWIARTEAIKIKHGIPLRKICVTAPGAPFFAKYLAKVLDADYKEMPPFKDHNYEIIYLLGFYPSIAEQCSMVFIDPKHFGRYQDIVKEGKEVPLFPGVKAIHLIGTDLLQMRDLPLNHLKVIQHFLNNKYDYVFTEFEQTQKEAAELGIRSSVLPLPPRKFFDVTPFPEKPTVAVYAPDTNQALYNVDLMKEVAKKLPDVQFKFFGCSNVGREDNIDYVGYVNDMDAFVKDCTALVRMTVHDGLPQSVLEFLSAGRRVLFNGDVPYVNTANKQLSVPAIVKALKSELKEGLNEEAAAWVRKEFSQEEFIKRITSLTEYSPKEFWERRAEAWAALSKTSYKADWENVGPFIEKLKPESVIDIGCGTGQWSVFFDCPYLGIDISQKLVDIAKKEYPTKKFVVAKLEDYESDEKFDLAFAYTCFEHIKEEDMPKAIESLKKLAKRAVIVEPENIVTRQYCINHDYAKWFNIVEKHEIGTRTLMVVDLR